MFLTMFPKTFPRGGNRNHFFFDNENLTKFFIIVILKTADPIDALIARPGAWSIESTNILLARDETCFVKSRSEDCFIPFSRLILRLIRWKTMDQYGH